MLPRPASSRRSKASLVVALVLGAFAACRADPPKPAASTRPDAPFPALVEQLSEPGGYFDTDNLISNEASYLHALGPLRRRGIHGGAYIGVGPDQNFSYIAQIQPEIAFVLDIRRDNLLEHLWLRSLFELARDRADYLSLMFGRPRPSIAPDSGVAGLRQILDELSATPPDPRRVAEIRAAVHRQLAGFGVPLSATDTARIDSIHGAFVAAGPGLRFTSFGRGPRTYYPTYRELLLETDRDGHAGSYLASEDAFRRVARLEKDGRVIPVVGDLAGDHALAAIGHYLRERGTKVTAFYTSNVEFYLMRGGGFDHFAATVADLPRSPDAVLVRSWFHPFGPTPPDAAPGYASTQIVQPMDEFVERTRVGGYRSYAELVGSSHLPD